MPEKLQIHRIDNVAHEFMYIILIVCMRKRLRLPMERLRINANMTTRDRKRIYFFRNIHSTIQSSWIWSARTHFRMEFLSFA